MPQEVIKFLSRWKSLLSSVKNKLLSAAANAFATVASEKFWV